MSKENKIIYSELFDDHNDAEMAYKAALDEGYTPEELHVFMSDGSHKKYYDSAFIKAEAGDKSMEGFAIGGAVGGAVVGALAAIAAIGTTITLPGLGIFIGGPLAAGLAGVGAGSISGGIIGALVGWGIPEERATIYDREIKKGGIVLGVDKIIPNSDLENKWSAYKSKSY